MDETGNHLEVWDVLSADICMFLRLRFGADTAQMSWKKSIVTDTSPSLRILPNNTITALQVLLLSILKRHKTLTYSINIQTHSLPRHPAIRPLHPPRPIHIIQLPPHGLPQQMLSIPPNRLRSRSLTGLIVDPNAIQLEQILQLTVLTVLTSRQHVMYAFFTVLDAHGRGLGAGCSGV